MWRIVLILMVFAFPVFAETRQIAFAPTDAEIQNPERGWWLFAEENFATADADDMEAVVAEGVTVAYGIVRLDDYRLRPIDGAMLVALEAAFIRARQAGVKIILRFAYNYPGSSQEYEDAQDAPLDVVLGHIEQLSPIIHENADMIVVWQAGFIGAWGEGHTSSNGLDSPAAKAAIRDAIYAHAPDGMALQWRYPPDILSWPGDTRMGFHNDCFLSSETDVGTYAEDPTLRAEQRAAMMALTEDHFFSGEVCDADADAARMDCGSILAEGADFHLSSLNMTYYEAFHNQWKAEGCYAEIGNLMGYRLALVSAELGVDVVTIALRNDGWAAPVQARPLVLQAYQGETLVGEAVADKTLNTATAGQVLALSARLPGLTEADRICLSAPDRSPRLAPDVAYAIRFANADQPGQAWDATLGAFCFNAR